MVSIILSLLDSVAYVYRNGVQIGRSTFGLDPRRTGLRGSHVYSALARVDAGGRRDWLAVTSIGGGKPPDIKALVPQTKIPPEFVRKVRPVIAPGTTLILTDLPVSLQTRSQGDFRILTTDTAR